MSALSNKAEIVDKWITCDGWVTEKNKSDIILLNEMLKPHKVKCFKVAVELLEKLEVPYFVSDGTLLAIYRDQGNMIPHDADTDVSIMEEDLHTIWKNRHLLPAGYTWKTDCPDTGVEWCDENGCRPFDPAIKGTKNFTIFDSADYSHYLEHFAHNPMVKKRNITVSTDIYTYSRSPNDEAIVQVNWSRHSHGVEKKRFAYDWIFPLKKYTFEGVECYGPNKPELWLNEYYGYLGRDAYFDPEVKAYKKME